MERFVPEEWQLASVSIAELERRWSALRKLMIAVDVDTLIISASTEQYGGYVRYVTGVPPKNGIADVVVFSLHGAMRVVRTGMAGGRRPLDFSVSGVHRGVELLVTEPYRPGVSFSEKCLLESVAETVKSVGASNLGVIGSGELMWKLSNVDVQGPWHDHFDMTSMFEVLMSVKSPEELEATRRAARIQDEVMAELGSMICSGVYEFEIALTATNLMERLGSTSGHVLVGSGAADERMVLKEHRSVMTRKLSSGDHVFVLIEMNGPEGYFAELGRQFVLGDVAPEMVDELIFFNQARDSFIDQLDLKSDVLEACEEFSQHLVLNGREPQRRFFLHGQGYSMVERPHFIAGETMGLSVGMNLACHPFSVNGNVMVGMSDNYICGDSGRLERIHKTEKTIFVV
ncbi:M24 family metallopeptidase [uncultured Pseudoteredinibacter sp.]|uniref:M24 family metallopeptidase n=1 Tax=uncultured Pseudoteredinibacter sp. TaxID=1641701 RepID=UPI00260735F3|nr:M24 family metallopeptidase [uncultured Pseudoteredinibacter sp.]